MFVQGLGNLAAAYVTKENAAAQRQPLAATTAAIAEKITISAHARDMLAQEQGPAEAASIQRQLDAIKAKPALERTDEDVAFLHKNDKRLAAIAAKDDKTRTADELDYLQKVGGFVNTMAELTPQEKALYDELVAAGEWEAASAFNLVGMSRIGMGGQQVTLPNGKTFDPTTTEVTAGNLRNLFKLMFVDPSGQTDRQFEALARALERREATAPA